MIVTFSSNIYILLLLSLLLFGLNSENVELCRGQAHSTINCTVIESINNAAPNNTFETSDLFEDSDGGSLEAVSKLIGSYLRTIVNEELGVTAMQGIFDNLDFIINSPIDREKSRQIADKISSKIHRYTLMLEKLKVAVEESFLNHLSNPGGVLYRCCSISEEKFKYLNHFGTKVFLDKSCDLVPSSFSDKLFTPSENLTKVFIENLQVSPSIKWQYFISNDSLVTQYPSPLIPQERPCVVGEEFKRFYSYESTVYSKTKLLIIMIDQGSPSNLNQLYISKLIGKHIVSLASPQDHIAVFGVSSGILYPGGHKCLSSEVPLATDAIKLHFSTFIERLSVLENRTNHSLGFEAAFKLIGTFGLNYNGDILLYYVSKGLLTSVSDEHAVLKTIAQNRILIGLNVIINTFTVLNEENPTYVVQFMKNIADQNYQKFNIEFHEIVTRGLSVAISSIEEIPQSLGDIFSPLTPDRRKIPHFSIPHWDHIGKGLVISITRSCFHKEDIIGVVGLDVHLADIVEDLTYLSNFKNQYGFLFDHSGNTLSHPSFSSPVLAMDQPVLNNIKHLEYSEDFGEIFEKLLNSTDGVATLEKTEKTYMWFKVVSTPYIMCIVTVPEHKQQKVLKPIHSSLDVVYHRIDFLSSNKRRHMCQHFQQIASIDTSGLYLSATAFVSPFEYLMHNPSPLIVQSYMAYINDTTKLIANPGLKDDVRSDAVTVAHITNHWKSQLMHSRLGEFIIRRYISTPSGVFLTYPAFVIDQLYDPLKRPWYLRAALEYPGKVVVSPPYLDSTGAGYIITVSHSIYEGKSAALHNSNDSVVAVMGIDFTIGYFLNLLYEYLPECGQTNVKCFLFDDKGYLVADPDLSIVGPKEDWQHITQEALVANGLLIHQGLVKKIMCNSITDGTVQRLYQFNVSIEGVLTNLLHEKHCSKYYITAVPGTNLFIGIVNKTCAVTAFCPCSVHDRLCLNCNKMEQQECECPCECPLEIDYCTGDLLEEQLMSNVCPGGSEASSSYFQEMGVLSKLPPCLSVSCENRKSRSQCLGVLGCQWCIMESDGETLLKSPVCLRQSQCFGGILGGPSPYGDVSINILSAETLLNMLNMRSTPVGPVAGGIMACFILLALGVYCYRHHTTRGTHAYLSSAPGSGIRMAQFHNEAEEADSHDDLSYGHNNVMLAQIENNLPISPYRMNTSYRRPPGAESDHGYSTMTPHEDSEHIPYIEPLIRENNPLTTPSPKEPSMPNLIQAQSDVANVENDANDVLPISLQTQLPPPHILAHVQVHVADTY